MSNASRVSLPMTPAAMIAAPRHLWLATLGAAALTREWAERDAAAMFRSLVNEGYFLLGEQHNQSSLRNHGEWLKRCVQN